MRPGSTSDRFMPSANRPAAPRCRLHARLANAHKPLLKAHDRFGRRIDQVEFHPSYHALLGAALGHGLHGTPWRQGPGAHVQRAAAFMLFTELEPSVLCPVSMTYAVTPALRANPVLHAAWGGKLAGTAYDPRDVPFEQKAAVTMGMGMTEKQGGSDVRANTTHAEFDGDTRMGTRVPAHRTQVVLLGADVATPSWCWRRPSRAMAACRVSSCRAGARMAAPTRS